MKKELYLYRGPQKECFGMIYEKLESPPEEKESWQSEGEKFVFLHSLDKHLQPDAVKNKFCDYDLGSLSDLSFCKVSKNGVGGFLSMETEEDFSKFYHKIGKK